MSRIVRSKQIHMFCFNKLLPVFQNGCASLHSRWQFYLFGILADTFSPFNFIRFDRCVMASHCFHVFSLISNDVFICWFHVLIGHLDVLFFLFYFWLQWNPTPVLLPGKSHGRRSLVGCSPWVAKSRTRLSDFPFTFHFHALEKEMATHSSVLA